MAKKEAKKQDRATEYFPLPNGCKFTAPYINPANWESSKASVKKPWFIKFTFHDPVRGIMEVKWRAGNKFKTLPERQDAARQLLIDTVEDLKRGLNPITGKVDPLVLASLPDQDTSLFADPETQETNGAFLTAESPLADCIKWAYGQFDDKTGTKKDMVTYMNHINPALVMTHYHALPVKEITPQHILRILTAASKVTSRWDEKLKKDRPLAWSNYKYNKTLDYLSMLFNQIAPLQIITTNPCHGLHKKKWGKKPKIALTEDECFKIDQHLKKQDPNFHRFIQLFHCSGSRQTELMKIQAKDVFIEQNVFYRWVLKVKNKEVEQVRTTIPETALPLWRALLAECTSPDDYLFGRGFKPGKVPIAPNNINIYWAELVQKPLGIKQGPYILKSMYLTALKKKYGSGIAAAHAAHKSEQMVDEVYDLDKEANEHERIKAANISFAPSQPRLPAFAPCARIIAPYPILAAPSQSSSCAPQQVFSFVTDTKSMLTSAA